MVDFLNKGERFDECWNLFSFVNAHKNASDDVYLLKMGPELPILLNYQSNQKMYLECEMMEKETKIKPYS